MYVAAKTGLSIREKPDAGAKVLDKIPYGAKVVLLDNNEQSVGLRTEGLLGYWRKVNYNGKIGYILDSYLLPVAPPKAGTKDMKTWLAQVTVPFGNKLVIGSNTPKDSDEPGWQLHKQFYKNGAETHQFLGYEYGSNTYFLPEFTMQQAFLLLRMMPEFEEVVGAKDEFPLESKKLKKGEKEYDIKVDKEMISTEPWVKRISIEFEDGAIYSFELYQVDNQIVIFYGAGV
jgi:Bacterial SH3 domain